MVEFRSEMPTYVAFLRAINVGGHVVKMDHLKKLFEGMGLSNVRTFIASGNVLFESPARDSAALEKKIAAALQKALGYEVATFVRTPAEVAEIAARDPFDPSDITEGSAIYIGLYELPFGAKERQLVAAMSTAVDSLHVHKREVYWLARKRFIDSDFSPARMEKALKVKATFRNVTTMRRIAALCEAQRPPAKKGK